MQTITLDSPGNFSISQTEIPKRPPDSALVRIYRVGICGTDLHAFRGRQPFLSYPRILGHELGVQIMEIDANDQDLHAGDICAIEPYLNCGRCISCRQGKTNCCTTLQTLGVHTDGGMREFITIPVNSSILFVNVLSSEACSSKSCLSLALALYKALPFTTT